MSSKRKYKESTVVEKLKAIEDVKSGMPVRAVAEKYGISIGTVSNWKNQNEKLVEIVQQNAPIKRTRLSRLAGKSSILDERMYNWFAAARSRNIPISGTILQEKAKQVADILELEQFKASNGWLESFRKRHNICFRTLSGEGALLDKGNVENWKESLPHILNGYEPCNIWNLDETGLFWHGLPKKSLIFKEEEAKGGKLAKERLTICLLCSSTGEKFKPLVIGKAAMPRAFNKVLPKDIIWRSNSKAWMTATYFMEYLQNFNCMMERQNRKVLLLLDNAPCHPHFELNNVKLIFLPPNTTAATQPLDAGIIRCFKLKYRQLLLNHLLISDNITEGIHNYLKSINVKHAIKWILLAWNDIKMPIFINCFKHVGISGPNVTEISLPPEENFLIASANMLSIEEPECINEDIQTYDFVDSDNWEDAILNPRVDETTETENLDESKCQIKPTMSKAMECLKILSEYAICHDLDYAMEPISKLQQILISKKLNSMKSTTLDHFFNKD